MTLTSLLSPREAAPSDRMEGGALPQGKARGEEASVDASVRKCLVCGETKAKELMIRFVVGPEGRVVPDLAGKLPGRGLWVSSTGAALAEAVRKNLFKKAAKGKAEADADLPQQVERLLERRCLELLGLARGAGLVVSGEPQVLDAFKKGHLAFVLLALDAGQDIQKKLSSAPCLTAPFGREALGAALGRGISVALGLKPGPLANKLKTDLTRLSGVKSIDQQPSVGSAAHNPECGHHD